MQRVLHKNEPGLIIISHLGTVGRIPAVPGEVITVCRYTSLVTDRMGEKLYL